MLGSRLSSDAYYGTVSRWPWTDRLYVCIVVCMNLKLLFVFDAVRGHNLTLICCPNTLQWWCSVHVYLRWIYGTVSCWPWTNSPYVCIVLCLNLKLLFVFDAVWGRNLTLMCCPNTLQWWCSVHVYLRWMNGTVSCWSWTNSGYVFIAVCLDSNLFFVFDVVWDRNLTLIAVQIHYDGDARSALNLWNGCVDPGRSGCTFALLRVWIWHRW